MRSLKEVDCHHRRGAKREPYNYVESFDKAAIRHSTILHCEETLADSKYTEFSLGLGSVISRECGDRGSAFDLFVYC